MVVPYVDSTIKGKMPIAYIVPSKDLSTLEKDPIVAKIVQVLTESDDTSDRDIPRKLCFISTLPQNSMSKNDYKALMLRELDGSEYTIEMDETNLTSGKVRIIQPPRNQ